MGTDAVRAISEYVQLEAFVSGVLPSDGLFPDAELEPGGDADDHGNLDGVWLPPVDVGVYAFDPGASSEPRLPGQERVVAEPVVFLPEGVLFGPYDRVTARGLAYEVDGHTREWVSPSGSFRAGVSTLRRVEG